MATIYKFYDIETDYYLTLESITTNGYFPLTVMQGDRHNVLMFDDLSMVTQRVSELLKENGGMDYNALTKVMEKILTFFDGDDVEVWYDEDLPYILVNTDY